jgi:Kef-type K+ transport system membrane component KefB
VPIGAAVFISMMFSSSLIIAGIWIVVLVWMGIGCLLNARRCHRLHCYFSAPIMLLGALVVGLIGFGVVTLGAHALNNTISITLVLALLSFIPEMIWGKYVHSQANNESESQQVTRRGPD